MGLYGSGRGLYGSGGLQIGLYVEIGGGTGLWENDVGKNSGASVRMFDSTSYGSGVCGQSSVRPKRVPFGVNRASPLEAEATFFTTWAQLC